MPMKVMMTLSQTAHRNNIRKHFRNKIVVHESLNFTRRVHPVRGTGTRNKTKPICQVQNTVVENKTIVHETKPLMNNNKIIHFSIIITAVHITVQK